jgi:DNA-binding PadR family transcriptional regulator
MRIGCGPRFTFRDLPPGLFAMGFGPARGRRRRRAWEGDWSAEFGHARGGRGRRRMFESGELRLVLLKLIADQPAPRLRPDPGDRGAHPRQLCARAPGVVYPTLTMLQDMGLIQEAAAEGTRKAFAVTPEGAAHLAERADEVEALFERLTGAGEGKRRAGGRPIQRAVGNLLSALWHRVTADDTDEPRLHEIAPSSTRRRRRSSV